MTSPSDTELCPLFLGQGAGQRFALHLAPRGCAPRALVLYLHPLAEEMNKSRRMAALAARALAARGCAVLQLDLAGCGDSAGDFADASWSDWVEDALAGCHWLRAQHPGGVPLHLWGLRTGALLAAQAAGALDEDCHLLLWQPAVSGKVALQQFLRLRLAAELGEGNAAGLMKSLRQQLAEGRTVEVAGYGLAPALAAGLEAATLAPPPRRAGRVAWLEVAADPAAEPSPVTLNALSQWRQAGWQAELRRVAGPAFWQTAEIETAPALLEATLQALQAQEVVA